MNTQEDSLNKLPDKDELNRMLNAGQDRDGLSSFLKAGLAVGGIIVGAKVLDSLTSNRNRNFVPGKLDNVTALGKAILQRRLDLGLTQVQLSKRSGVGLRFISEVENGKPRAEIAKIFQLMDSMDIQLSAKTRSRS